MSEFFKSLFDRWNIQKKEIQKSSKRLFFKEREIWFCSMGENIGDEEAGKGKMFLRPVLILKKFNNNIFWGIPLFTTLKGGIFYFQFSFLKNVISSAIFSQLRLFDSMRLQYKRGYMNKENFLELKQKLKTLL